MKTDYTETERVAFKVPKGAEPLVVLARIGTELWCGSLDTPSETIRHLRAAADELELRLEEEA